MTAEQKAAYVKAQAAMLNAEIAAAQAENENRAHRGLSPAYDEKVIFDNIIRRYEPNLDPQYLAQFFNQT